MYVHTENANCTTDPFFQYTLKITAKLITERDFLPTYISFHYKLSTANIFFYIHYRAVIMTPHDLHACVQTPRYVTAPCENTRLLEHEACQDDALAFHSSENNECLALSHAILRPYHLNKGSYSCLLLWYDLCYKLVSIVRSWVQFGFDHSALSNCQLCFSLCAFFSLYIANYVIHCIMLILYFWSFF